VTIGGRSPEDEQRQTAGQALAEARRKVERAREVRAALGSDVLDARMTDDRMPSDDTTLLRHTPRDRQ
jgi:hypothetical protein